MIEQKEQQGDRLRQETARKDRAKAANGGGAQDRQKELYQTPLSTHHTYRLAVIAVGLVLLAAWLRLWRLDSVPPGLWFDESLNGMEAIWMLKTKTWPIFIREGQGREVMFYYFLALSISVLGQTSYAIRLVPALLGIFTISVMYRWATTIYTGSRVAGSKETGSLVSGWVAVISTAGLALSFWYVTMNRVGYRANTLLPVMLLTCYFFWRGWQSGRRRDYLWAGVGLGLCQYTYLAGRLVPLVFIVFVVAQTLLTWKKEPARLRTTWIGLLMMGGIATLVTFPLLLFFVDYPELFWERGGDVALKAPGTGAGVQTLIGQIAAAARVFIDGQDPNWRHHLLGRPVFDGFGALGFWVGLVITLRGYRRPAHLFLLIMLWVMWLPALLAEPAFHTLRLVGILPAYYMLAAIGLLTLAHWIGRRISSQWTGRPAGFVTLVALLLLSGGSTYYDYFYRWAGRPEVYQAFDGSVVDLAQRLASSDANTNLIIPFYLYTHPSMRYVLHPHFNEAVVLPEAISEQLSRQEKVELVIPEYPEDDRLPPAWVWLIKDETSPGTAYVSAVNRDWSLSHRSDAGDPVALIEGSRANLTARQYELNPEDVLPLFRPELPGPKITAEWADRLGLTGYEFVPPAIEAGNQSTLNLAWKILSYTGLEETMFLQLLDRQGNPVGQQEIEPLSRKMYRWREQGLILEQHSLNFDPDLSAGLYFVRLGFFDPKTGQRLPAYGPDQQSLGNEVIVGPLYVSAHGINPTQPQSRVKAKLGDEFELLGYSIYAGTTKDATEIELFWKTDAPVKTNYTVFVQLLDKQNQIIAQADAQPLPNLYPTSRWQPGDIISDRFVLPVAEQTLAKGGKLITGMYDLSTGARLPVYSQQGDLLPHGMVTLINENVR